MTVAFLESVVADDSRGKPLDDCTDDAFCDLEIQFENDLASRDRFSCVCGTGWWK